MAMGSSVTLFILNTRDLGTMHMLFFTLFTEYTSFWEQENGDMSLEIWMMQQDMRIG
jgi:hypothetical protein